MVPFQTKCMEHGCGRRATHEVFGTRNDSYGKYCRACASRRLKSLQATEDKLFGPRKGTTTQGG